MEKLSQKKIFYIFLALLFIVLSPIILNLKTIKDVYQGLEPEKEYAKAYSLISKKVSQSANLIINLPKNISANDAKQKIKFNPPINGVFIASGKKNELRFKPDENLEIGKYYSISLGSAKGTTTNEFLVEDDPRVINVFPKSDSETHEKSNISIIFNRPMVPLTTLDAIDLSNLPIEITPATEGKFKWISTKTLQFIAKNNLIASANYTVKIKPKFTSMDGLSIKAFEHKFITRKLRYEQIYSGEKIYNQPFTLMFNQDVDLAKTTQGINVKNNTLDKKIEFISEYGTKKIYNKNTKKYDKIQDKSKINIFNKIDTHGRTKLWDFNTNYTITINKAYPIAGDIILEQDKEFTFNITNIIKEISAESERSNQVHKDFFDPQGKLWIEFYEEIDLAKSQISHKKIINSGYGEKCSEDEETLSRDLECEKITDKKKIYLVFDSNIAKGEYLKINFEKIVNSTGLQINQNTIEESIMTVPRLQITKTVPGKIYKEEQNDLAPTAINTNSGEENDNASLTQIIVCSTSPLVPMPKEDIDEFIKSNLDYEFVSWRSSYLVEQYNENEKCRLEEFRTAINYRLMPESDYEFTFNFQDPFDGTETFDIKFRTKKMDEKNLSFFHFQKNYNVTTPDKTTLSYAATNMDFVNMHICKLGPDNMIKYLYNSPAYYESPSIVKGCQEESAHRIDLPKKYWIKNYFQINMKDYITKYLMGNYIITFSNPSYRQGPHYAKRKQIYERTYLNITNIGVTKKEINIGKLANKDKKIENLYFITDLKTLNPTAGADIEIYQRKADRLIEKIELASTNEKGIARTKATNNIIGTIIKKGVDNTIVINNKNKLSYGSTAYTDKKIYLYTDRPIYKPRQDVYIKGLYRIGFDGDYEIYKDKKINVKIFNSKHEEVVSEKLEVNNFGTFNTSFQIDEAAPLGRYRISSEYGSTFFDVQEYVPAPFKVETKLDKEEYKAGDTFNLEIDANYYFGAPVNGGVVEYSIASQDYHFDKYEDEYFNFGQDWYFCYWECSFNDKFILRNKTELDKYGKAKISKKLDLEKLTRQNKSKIFVVYMSIKNENGQSVSAQKSFIVHAGEFYLGVKTDKRFIGKNEKFKAKVKTVNTLGTPVRVKSIEFTINKIDWVRNKRKEVDGGYYYKWEEKLSQISSQTINTNNDGDWEDDISIKENGEYKIILNAKDSAGNNITNSSYMVYVYGEGHVDIMPSNDTSLKIEKSKDNLNVGDTAEIVIKSPYKKAKALIAIERGEIFDYEIVDINQSLFKYSFPIKKEYVPNVFVSATLISDIPEIKHGNTRFNINVKENELDIEVKANKEFYLPGEKVILDIIAKDNSGKPRQAEVSVSVADLSVLALKGNPKKNPLVFFYSGFPLVVSTVSNIKNILNEIDVPTGTKGGGGGESAQLAKKKRGEFKDTAFWQANVITDANGKARVEFTLPDNLTTWQIESIGITTDTKLGSDYQEFIAQKQLMLTPLKPRFAIPGDEFYIGAKIYNKSTSNQDLNIELFNSNLELNDKSIKAISLNADESTTVYFKVKAPENINSNNYRFTISAKNKILEDTVEQTIKIVDNNTYENTATAGYSSKKLVNEYIYLPSNIVDNKGELTINTSATLALFLSDALNYMLAFPYGCAEQIASKLDTVAAIKRGLNIENIGDKFDIKKVELDGKEYGLDELVEVGLEKIYAMQRDDGGFGYYSYATYSSYYLSLHIAKTFKNLENAGYEIDKNKFKDLFNYINSQVNSSLTRSNSNFNDNAYIIAAFALNELKSYGAMSNALREKIRSISANEQFINDKISNLSLSYLVMLSIDDPTLFSVKTRTDLFNTLENRIEIDSRGAFLPVNRNYVWSNYETSIKDTALLLKTLVKAKKDNNLLGKVMRWLLKSRSKDGSWGSTNNTITVINAMSDYLLWQEEAKSDFKLDIMLDQKLLKSFNYSQENILDQNNIELALQELARDKLQTLSFAKTNNNNKPNNFYYDMALKYYLPVNDIAARDEGLAITRNFYSLDDTDYQTPITKAKVGDILKGRIIITLPKARNFVAIEDFIPAGVELVNFDLATESKQAIENKTKQVNEDSENNNLYSGYSFYDWKQSRAIRPDFKEIRDDRLFLFKERMNEGEYEFEYYVRVLIPGKFHHLPAIASEMYFPENFGRTRGDWFKVVQ